MAERNERSLRKAIAPLAISGFLALPVLYALSAGPAFYLHTRGLVHLRYDSGPGLFYIPLRWAELNCRPFGRMMLWYTQKWEHKAPGSTPFEHVAHPHN
jgi:hypothetical protein